MQLFSKEAFRFQEQLRNFGTVQHICLCGLFVAIYVVLSFFNIKMTTYLEFRFAFLALAAAGMYGGPMMGMFVGMGGDIVSYFAAPQSGAFFPGFTLSYALLGFMFGLILYKSKITPIRIAAASFAEFVIAISLNTLWLHFMYGMEWKYLFTIRLIKCLISLGVNAVLLYVFLKAFAKIISLAGMPVKAGQQQ